MSNIDPRAAERTSYDDTAFDEVDLTLAEDVRVARRPGPRSTFALRLDGDTIEQLREVAIRYHTRPTQLARDWIIERLEREKQISDQFHVSIEPLGEEELQALIRGMRTGLAYVGRKCI